MEDTLTITINQLPDNTQVIITLQNGTTYPS